MTWCKKLMPHEDAMIYRAVYSQGLSAIEAGKRFNRNRVTIYDALARHAASLKRDPLKPKKNNFKHTIPLVDRPFIRAECSGPDKQQKATVIARRYGTAQNVVMRAVYRRSLNEPTIKISVSEEFNALCPGCNQEIFWVKRHECYHCFVCNRGFK